LVRTGGHDIVEQLKADIPLALAERHSARVNAEAGCEYVTALEDIEHPAPASGHGHDPFDDILAGPLLLASSLLSFSNIFPIRCIIHQVHIWM